MMCGADAAAGEDSIDLTNGGEPVNRAQWIGQRIERAVKRGADVRRGAKDLLRVVHPQLTAGGEADDDAVDAEVGELSSGPAKGAQFPRGHLVASVLTNHDPKGQRRLRGNPANKFGRRRETTTADVADDLEASRPSGLRGARIGDRRHNDLQQQWHPGPSLS